ncbi:MAG: HD-GYP domain-containing protein [Actinomycetota bacterium]
MTALPRRLAGRKRKIAEFESFQQVIDTLIATVNDHDTYTGGHSRRVADFVTHLARLMDLHPHQIALSRQAGFVHDVGKIGIPDKILKKKEPLTDEEFHLIRLHPILGASILSRMPGMEAIIPIVLHHHERWDGGGYPSGLAGTDIPLEARIIFVADAFDAMTTDRPYGRVLSTEEALAEVREGADGQFDPSVAVAMQEAFGLGLLEDGPEAAPVPAPDLARYSLAL